MKVEEVEITEDEYEEYLNDLFGTIEVCGYKYDSGTLLKQVDSIAFNCGVTEFPIEYKCGICGTVYSDEDKAEDCCSEHEED